MNDNTSLMGQLYALEQALWAAGDRGDPIAMECRASSIPTMLARLTQAFESRPGSASKKEEISIVKLDFGSTQTTDTD